MQKYGVLKVQIIQINLVLKNYNVNHQINIMVQIIQINLVLKNKKGKSKAYKPFK